MKEKAIIILSGGLDSATTLFKAIGIYEVLLALTFDYGQRAAQKEIAAARALCEIKKIPHQVLEFPWLAQLTHTSLVNRNQEIPKIKEHALDDLRITSDSAKAVWVPNRNGLFIHVAACFADQRGASVILTGFNREEAITFPDNSEEFVKTVNQSLFYSTQVHARVESLTQSMSKEEIVREAMQLHLPFEKLWSCYEGGENRCGLCESCLRILRAYRKAGVKNVFFTHQMD